MTPTPPSRPLPTPREDASQISTRTVRAALASFGIGRIKRISRLHGGAGTARKFLVEIEQDQQKQGDEPPGSTSPSDHGIRLLLKCAPRDSASLDRIVVRHAVVKQLASAGVPVAAPREDSRGGTVLADASRVYELIPFIEGESWKASPARARGAGGLLARLHDATGEIDASVLARLRPPTGFLAGDDLQSLVGSGLIADDGTELGFLRGTLAECLDRVRAAGLGPAMPALLVHGDFHPGNMRWRGDDVAGLFDFDACRRGFAIEEAALASVHFSIDRGSKAMDARAPWPDTDLLEAFWIGYGGIRPIDERHARAVPWIAAGAFAIEALSGSNSGTFSPETIAFASGVVAWLVEHADGLGELIAQAGPPMP